MAIYQKTLTLCLGLALFVVGAWLPDRFAITQAQSISPKKQPSVLLTDHNKSTSTQLEFQASKIFAIGANTCALSTTGGVKCWGDNQAGQIGNSTFITSETPSDVVGLSLGITHLALGAGNPIFSESHLFSPSRELVLEPGYACALKNDHTGYCWGNNKARQLLDNSAENQATPVILKHFAGKVAQFATGTNFVCVLLLDGQVYCWGSNANGILDQPNLADSRQPIKINRLSSEVKTLVAGHAHACALLINNDVECWGSNTYGQLGVGTIYTSSIIFTNTTFTKVYGLNDVITDLVAGSNGTCVINQQGRVKCWGQSKERGLIATELKEIKSKVLSLSLGSKHSCAITEVGTALCWGNNGYGQLGNGVNTFTNDVVLVQGITQPIISIAAGYEHTCAVLADHQVRCWGRNYSGVLGIGNSIKIPLHPTATLDGPVKDLKGLCALTTTGSVYCWDTDHASRLESVPNNINYYASKIQRLGDDNVALATGVSHGCAAPKTGGVKCWGNNRYGQLGDTTLFDSTTAIPVQGISEPVTALAAGPYYTCALTQIGQVKCWGRNNFQLFQTNGPEVIYEAVLVENTPPDIKSIVAGELHVCVLTQQGAVYCWGSNDSGQLGLGDNQRHQSVVGVPTLERDVKLIAAGLYHTCALLSTGAVKCWGSNYLSQITTRDQTCYSVCNFPTLVSWVKSSAIRITAEGDSTCIQTNDYVVLCNGYQMVESWDKSIDWDRLVKLGEELMIGNSNCLLTNTGAILGCRPSYYARQPSEYISRPVPVYFTAVKEIVKYLPVISLKRNP